VALDLFGPTVEFLTYLLGDADVLLLDPDAGALASWSRWRSSGLAIFPTAFFGSISSMYTSRGTL
jgi:hypothetical protein